MIFDLENMSYIGKTVFDADFGISQNDRRRHLHIIIVGTCHCTECRKATGGAFLSYAYWPRLAFSSTGETRAFAGRSFCPNCGSRLFPTKRRSCWVPSTMPGAEGTGSPQGHDGIG